MQHLVYLSFMALKKQWNTRHQIVWLLRCLQRGDTDLENLFTQTYLTNGLPLMAQMVKNPPATQEIWVQSLGLEDPLEAGTATHSSILTWRIPMEKPGGLQSMGCEESDTAERLSTAQHISLICSRRVFWFCFCF